MKKYDVIVIGAGLSGIVCAIENKRNGKSVLLLEANDRIGKKILATGNGKCNILNKNLSIEKYNNDFLKKSIDEMPVDYLEKYLNKVGLLLRVDSEGREYPYSEAATTVLNVLLDNLKKENVEVVTSQKVVSIKKADDFIVKTVNNEYKSHIVVLATGSNASFGLNSHSLLKELGHNTTKLTQTLVPIKIDGIKGCGGVRAKVHANLYINNELVYSNNGEMLFKDNVISGIISFQLSSFISRSITNGTYRDGYIVLDFVPDYSLSDLENYIKKYGYVGIVHKSILQNIDKNNMAYELKNYKLKVTGLQGIEQAQVISGGLKTTEFYDTTFESKKIKNLYAIGEVLDVDGECGGYNLSAALIMGIMCARGINNENQSK